MGDSQLARDGAPQPPSFAAEWAVHPGQEPVVFIVLLKLHIDPLVEPDVHKVDRRSSFPNHLQVGPVLGIVEAPQLTVVDAKAVGPDVQDALLYGAVAGGGRDGAAAGVGDDTAFHTIAAKCLAGAAELGPRGTSRFLVRLPGVPVAA